MNTIPAREYAPVCSYGILKGLLHRDFVPRYFLLLAHEVLENPDAWRELLEYAREYHAPHPVFVIMDNSLIELGYPLGAFQLAEACEYTQADALVLPDKLCDAEETVELSTRAVTELHMSPISLPSKTQLMAVVQGKTYEEMIWCAEALDKLPVEYLAVPRITVKNLGTRQFITQALWLTYKKYMHLLGFSDNVGDDLTSARLPGVMGIDSALPVVLGLANRRLYTTAKPDPRRIITSARIDRQPDFLSKNEEDITHWVLKNCQTTLDLVRGVAL